MLVIKDLEVSEELDREAMREIVGLGTRPMWPKGGRTQLVDGMVSNSGWLAAGRRWSAFLRPMKIEPLRPHLTAKRPNNGRK